MSFEASIAGGLGGVGNVRRARRGFDGSEGVSQRKGEEVGVRGGVSTVEGFAVGGT